MSHDRRILVDRFVGIVALVMLSVGCAKQETPLSSSESSSLPPSLKSTGSVANKRGGNEHNHENGAHGGIVVSLGRDSYHVEAIVTSTGELRFYTLGADESRVIAIEKQNLTAYVKAEGVVDATLVRVKPEPQPGDDPGKSSLFVGRLSDGQLGKSIDVTVPNITIAGERFRLAFTTKGNENHEEPMPTKVTDNAEQALYLTPGGLYTQADIDANGSVTASEKFDGFSATHDLNPKPGDRLCPITLTKANPQCSWIVGGQTYEFCCPPCVDEFLKLAKTNPDQVKQPERYVKRDSASVDLR